MFAPDVLESQSKAL